MFVSGVQMELVLEVMHVTQEDPTLEYLEDATLFYYAIQPSTVAGVD